MTIRMKSLKAHTFSGKRYQVNDEFDVPGESLARVLSAINTATRAPAAAPQAPEPVPSASRVRAIAPTYSTAALAASDLPEPQAEGEPRVKRQYRRRDLTAE